MSTIEDLTKSYQAAMPRDIAGTVNLMAHPLAGMAAAGALGLGLAGHAFGMWMGAVAGATEASQKLFAGLAEADQAPQPQPAKLRLVASQPEPAVSPTARPVARKAARKAEVPAPKAAVQPAAAVARPDKPDDLKAISGVGPKLEKVLNRSGISTYAQLAALTKAEIADLDARLGLSGRIGRDDWVGQAAALAKAGK